MPKFSGPFSLVCKHPRAANQQKKSRKWYHRLCFGLVRRATPSPKNNADDLKNASDGGSTSSPVSAEEPEELTDLCQLSERLMSRRLPQQRATQANTRTPQRPKDITNPRRAGGRRRRTYHSGMKTLPRAPIHSVDEEFDKELADLADLRWYCLAYLCSVYGKEKDPAGYVTLQGYYNVKARRYDSTLVPVTSYRLVRIDSLPLSEQNLHYETALSRAASVADVRAQYELHFCRYVSLQAEIAERREACRGLRRLGNNRYNAWFNANSQEPKGVTAIEMKAQIAFVAGQRAFEVRLSDVVAERGIIRLLERCEVMLKRADPVFVPTVWVRERRSRWRDARPGWTGLHLQN